jgi:hypothetical protein
MGGDGLLDLHSLLAQIPRRNSLFNQRGSNVVRGDDEQRISCLWYIFQSNDPDRNVRNKYRKRLCKSWDCT